MKSKTQTAELPVPAMEYGKVVSCAENSFFSVQAPFAIIEAKQAISCLVKPVLGDQVLLSIDISGKSFILSVLERDDYAGVTEVVIPGEAVLHAQSGSLRLSADNTVSLTATETVEVASSRMVVNVNKGEVSINKLTFLGKAFHASIKRISTVAHSIDQSMKRLTQRMENSEKFVEDHEEIQTGSTRYLVEDTLTTHAGNTMNISEDLHTMHAEQIHMS